MSGLGHARGSSGAGDVLPAQAQELVDQIVEHLINRGEYLSARLVRGKEWLVLYYAHDPHTGKWVRKREKINRIKDKKERLVYGLKRVRELNAALALGWSPFTHKRPGFSAPLLAEALTQFLETKRRQGIRPDSMRSYKSGVKLLNEWLEQNSLTDVLVNTFSEKTARIFMNDCYTGRELSARTFNNYHTFYITVWNWFKEMDYCLGNVFERVKKKKVDPEASNRRPPTVEERARIRAYLKEHNPRFFIFCLLCFHCGIRPKEALMLRPENFRLDRNHILIPASVAKNHRTQGVAIPSVLIEELRALNIESQPADHYVFSSQFKPGPKLCCSRDSGRAWDRMRDAISLDREVTFYQLKHAGGEQLSRDGVSEVDLMNHLRHHDLSETSTYTRRTYEQGVVDVLKKATPF